MDGRTIREWIESSGLKISDDPRLSHLISSHESGSNNSSSKLGSNGAPSTLTESLLVTRCLTGSLAVRDWPSFVTRLDACFEEAKQKSHGEGKVASYIPSLARVSPDQWGAAVCTIDGQRWSKGDASMRFSVQSTSKVVTYVVASENHTASVVHASVGVEPSGRAFNELALMKNGHPHNPFINSGAILTAHLASTRPGSHTTNVYSEPFESVTKVWEAFQSNRPVGFDNALFLGEAETADRNRCLALMMRESGALPRETDIEKCVSFYLSMCSLTSSCEDLALLAATLANDGLNPLTNVRVASSETIRNTLSLMSSCGMYDGSGAFQVAVGLPAKSGVSGVIICVVPGKYGFVTFSPRLNSAGNSVFGVEFADALAKKMDYGLFRRQKEPGHLSASGETDSEDEGRRPRSRHTTTSARTLNFFQDERANQESENEEDDEDDASSVSSSESSAAHDGVLERAMDQNARMLYASAHGHVVSLRHALAKGMKVDGSDYDGRTPLHVACSNQQTECVKLLVMAGAKLDAPRDRFGHTPLEDWLRAGADTESARAEWRELVDRAARPRSVGVNRLGRALKCFQTVKEPVPPHRLGLPCTRSQALEEEVQLAVKEEMLRRQSSISSSLGTPAPTPQLMSPPRAKSQLEELLMNASEPPFVPALSPLDGSALEMRHLELALASSGLQLSPETIERWWSNLTRRARSRSVLKSFERHREIRALQGRLVVPDWAEMKCVVDEALRAAASTPLDLDLPDAASYSPALRSTCRKTTSAAVVSVDGQTHVQQVSADPAQPQLRTTLQSTFTPFAYACALQLHGFSCVDAVVGVEPSGRSYKSHIVTGSFTHNALTNSGALVSCSLLLDVFETVDKAFECFAASWREASQTDRHAGECFVDEEVYRDELRASDHNTSLCYELKTIGAVTKSLRVADVVELYSKLCAVSTTVEASAAAAATLANRGVSHVSGKRVFDERVVQRVLVVMFSSGMYEASGRHAFYNGFPGKSGASGLTFGVVPDLLGYAVHSSPLDEFGNSKRGDVFSRQLARAAKLHVFDKTKNGRVSSSAAQPNSSSKTSTAAMKWDPRSFHEDEDEIGTGFARLMWAAARGDEWSARELVYGRGIDVRRADYDGRTALHLAASEKRWALYDFLIAAGADPEAKDRWGVTPREERAKQEEADAARSGNVGSPVRNG